MKTSTPNHTERFLAAIGVMFLFSFVVAIGIKLQSGEAKPSTQQPSPTKPARKAPPPASDEIPLSASAGCFEGRVRVENQSSDVWMDHRIEVNRVYSFTGDAIPPFTTLNYLPEIFVKSDGTRLDLDRTACLSIDIHATVNGQRRHWNGTRRP